MLTENQVVDFVAAWLEKHGHTIEVKHKDTAKGDDIKAVSSTTKEEIFVECKGAVSKSGNEISEWTSASMALFGAVLDTEYKRPASHHAIAIPDTKSSPAPTQSGFFES